MQDLKLYQLVGDGQQGSTPVNPIFEFRVYGTFCQFNFIYNCEDLYLVYTTKFILKSKTGFEFEHSEL